VPCPGGDSIDTARRHLDVPGGRAFPNAKAKTSCKNKEGLILLFVIVVGGTATRLDIDELPTVFQIDDLDFPAPPFWRYLHVSSGNGWGKARCTSSVTTAFSAAVKGTRVLLSHASKSSLAK